MRISDWSSDVCSSDLRPVRPVGETERCRGPAVPVGAAGHDVDLQSDAGRANHFGNRLAGVLLPGRIGAAVDPDLESVGEAGRGQQLLGLGIILYLLRQLGVFGKIGRATSREKV